ncbi:DUF5403 family protein [Saccharopolyspora indica]|uniref:DUF5403 family protein n=1 Tax=Saccharopolyspora indica TaxID=1229659 RepID=UPI0022EB5592|nr:DUF5403 family protein [Saccharopolyspora indica]MDA3643783.1 DUF5403 family protein [Saccharopolyspora indica]
MAKVQSLWSQKAFNNSLKDKKGVQAAVWGHALKVGAKAEARLEASKNRTGESQVLVRKGDVDAYVILDDEAALSIEFGHWLNLYGEEQPVFIPGKYVLTGAAGLI